MLTSFKYKYDNVCLTELGGSLLEIIDGYNLCKLALQQNIEINEELMKTWKTIESSDLLRETSVMLHPNNDILFFKSVDEFEQKIDSNSTNYLIDRAVGSYAFDSTAKYAEFISNFNICFLQIYGFHKTEEVILDPIGTKLRYFNLKELNYYLNGNLYYHYGESRPTRPVILNSRHDCTEGFFIYVRDENLLKMLTSSIKTQDITHQYFNYCINKATRKAELSEIGIKCIYCIDN